MASRNAAIVIAFILIEIIVVIPLFSQGLLPSWLNVPALFWAFVVFNFLLLAAIFR